MEMPEDQENALYKLAYLELRADRKDVGLWAMALAEADGNIPKAEARYIAKRVEQLKADRGVHAEASSARIATTPAAPQPATVAPEAVRGLPKNLSQRLWLGTGGWLVVNAIGWSLTKPGHPGVAESLGASAVSVLCAGPLWFLVAILRGGKFRASWKVYEMTLWLVGALLLLSFVLDRAAGA
jgi:hypothetical protein